MDGVLRAADGPGEAIITLFELADRVHAALLHQVGAFDAAEGWKADGAYSFACWLRARADASRAESLQLERFASRLRTMPATEAAVIDGKLPVAKARLLAGVINDRTAAKFAEHEALLIETVQPLSVDETKAVLDHWKRRADTDGSDPDSSDRNRASLSLEYNGRYHLEADLDPVGGATLKAVLEAIEQRMFTDGRFTDLPAGANTSGRRMADALVELADRGSGANPDQTAVHPDVIVVVPVDSLTNHGPDPLDPPTLLGTGPITLHDALRLAMLGTVSAMTVDGSGRPLNLGRKQRLASKDQWIAASVWHRGCVVPGCDRPASYCNMHHLTFWSHGGATDLDNLPLVCSKHHHLIHDDHWNITRLPDGSWQLVRPDGTVVDPPRYPGNQRPRARPPC